MKLEKNEIIIISIIYAATCLLLFYFQAKIIGPAIWGDEAVYFKLARSLHQNSTFSSSQYNILYPLVTSFAFFLPKVTSTYDAIKVMNVFMMASTVIPTYAIVRRIIKQPVIRYCASIAIALLPWCGTTLIIWAEPLFYPISIWAAYFFFSFIEKKSVSNIVKLAIGCTLLYLTKQAGLVFILAVEFAVIYDFILNCKDKRKDWGLWFSAILANIVPALLQMLVNKLNNQVAMGYADEIKGYTAVFTNFWQFVKAFMFQVSDVVLMSYLIFAVAFVIALIQIKKEEKKEQSKYIMVGLWTVGIILLSALHKMGDVEGDLSISYSRYTCVVIPYILMFGLKKILEYKKNKLYYFGIVVFSIICFLWSPISSAVYSYGFISCFGMGYMSVFVHGYNQIRWSVQEIPTVYIAIQLLIFIILGVLVLMNNKKIKMLALSILFGISLFAGMQTIRLVARTCGYQTFINEVYRFLVDSNIDISDVYMDEDCVSSNTYYFNSLWYADDEFNDDLSDAKYLISLDSQLAYEMIYSNSKYYIYYLEEDPMNQ